MTKQEKTLSTKGETLEDQMHLQPQKFKSYGFCETAPRSPRSTLFPSLAPLKISSLTHNDGRTLNLLKPPTAPIPHRLRSGAPSTTSPALDLGRRGREMEAVVSAQAELRKPGRRRFGRGVREMTGRRRPLSMQLQLVLMNDVLEDVVRTMREEGGGNSFVDSDGVFEMADGFSRQMAECTAAELAAEDYGFISLNKAVQEGAEPFEMYFEECDGAVEEQFFHRPCGKVRLRR
ncbi:LOW QUALITY PROTEIN: protein ELC-like [Asparagus officinalis]|uniref:LOW QUALITY PROTEIN: protein ELC-like n=1 Tax=Asparagus officinalis TaxID=4686 RepID=UPI00098E0A53|nr:LOW QUALITY PROTEIN: protein ELC-like [Asparagus officinalis]